MALVKVAEATAVVVTAMVVSAMVVTAEAAMLEAAMVEAAMAEAVTAVENAVENALEKCDRPMRQAHMYKRRMMQMDKVSTGLDEVRSLSNRCRRRNIR